MENPIKTESTLLYVDFIIPAEFKDEKLFFTTTTELIKENWKLYLIHGLNFNRKPQDFNADPDIEKKEIGICRNLDNFRFALMSNASRFNNGDETSIPSKVKYSVTFETARGVVKHFELISTEKNPVTFYTLINFKI